jgi:hypothetical protein
MALTILAPVVRMLFSPSLLAVTLIVTVSRIAAHSGTAPSLTAFILARFSGAVFLIRILRTPLESTATTLAAAAHWNLLD